MKKLLLICLIVFSCSTDSTDSTDSNNDNSEQDTTHLIVGQWSYERYVFENNGVITLDYLKNECTEQNVWLFNDNGNFTKNSYGGTSLEDCSNSTLNGTYTLNGDVLSLSEFEDEHIIEITSNTLIMKTRVCDDNDCYAWNIWYYNRVN